MIDYTDSSNIRLADEINKDIDLDFKSRVYFAIAYSLFIKIKKDVSDKSIINRLNTSFITIVNRSVNLINELSAVDTGVIKDYIFKFADFENSKIDNSFLSISSIYGLFKIKEIFGEGILKIIDKDLEQFKKVASLSISSKIFEVEITSIITGE